MGSVKEQLRQLTVYAEKKRCENHLGVNSKGVSGFKKVPVGVISRWPKCRASGTSKWSLGCQIRALCLQTSQKVSLHFARSGGLTLC